MKLSEKTLDRWELTKSWFAVSAFCSCSALAPVVWDSYTLEQFSNALAAHKLKHDAFNKKWYPNR
jgi:hypothetical protein